MINLQFIGSTNTNKVLIRSLLGGSFSERCGPSFWGAPYKQSWAEQGTRRAPAPGAGRRGAGFGVII